MSAEMLEGVRKAIKAMAVEKSEFGLAAADSAIAALSSLPLHSMLAALESLAAREAEVLALKGLLTEIEWSADMVNESGECVGACCPACYGLRDKDRAYGQYTAGHMAECGLSAAIRGDL